MVNIHVINVRMIKMIRLMWTIKFVTSPQFPVYFTMLCRGTSIVSKQKSVPFHAIALNRNHQQETEREDPLHPRTIPSSSPQTSHTPSPLPPLSPLVDPKHRTRHRHQLHQIRQPQRLSLENPLQRREIDNQSLAQQTPRHSVVEHRIRAFAPQWHLTS
jgi:hypothetical protein